MTLDVQSDQSPIDVEYLSPEAFARSPQVLKPLSLTWAQIAEKLATAHFTHTADVDAAKRERGSLLFMRSRDHLVGGKNVVHVTALQLDCDAVGVDEMARALAPYQALIHETFKSTAAAPRCRAFVRLADPLSVAEYERLHALMREWFGARDMPIDKQTGNVNRLSFLPMRGPGAPHAYQVEKDGSRTPLPLKGHLDPYAFRAIEGRPFDGRLYLRNHPPSRPPAARPKPPQLRHRDRYVEAALRHAAMLVASAAEGERNETLNAQAYVLGRPDLVAMGVTAADIRSALEAAAKIAGLGKTETSKTLRSAFRARGLTDE